MSRRRGGEVTREYLPQREHRISQRIKAGLRGMDIDIWEVIKTAKITSRRRERLHLADPTVNPTFLFDRIGLFEQRRGPLGISTPSTRARTSQ